MTYLTVPIAAASIEQAAELMKKAAAFGAEMLELRTDYLEDLTPDLAVRMIDQARDTCDPPLPIIVTCRSGSQGGANDYPANLRIEVLSAAVKAKAEYIDFEYEYFTNIGNQEKIRLALADGVRTRLILSAHNFNGPFQDLAKLYRNIFTTYSAAIPKLVYTANHINDCFPALDLLSRTSDDKIVLCMGPAGAITRILAKKLDSFVTFASIGDETSTAPGQLTITDLKNTYRWDDINEDTELYGVIGDPVAHSIGPVVHNACFESAKMNKLYLPVLLQGGKREFDIFVNALMTRRALGFKGFSVTIPHKQNALENVQRRMGKIEPLAEIIGASNTLILGPDDRTSVYNTDYKGALDAIDDAGIHDLTGVSAAVIGAGGVARALVAGLVSTGANITIYNRTVKKAQRLADEFKCNFAPLVELEELEAELVVNCTSIGMHPEVDASPLSLNCLKSGMTVFDTVYNPPETMLLRNAKAAGAKTISGIDMFINQAAAQFELFTKKTADTKLMRKIITKAFSS